MKIECQFMELGKPLFLAGTNYGEKLKEQCGKGTLSIVWDEEKRRAEIRDGRGFFTFVTEPWVFTYEPKQTRPTLVVNKSHAQVANVSAKAQVGGPQDVFRAQVSTPMEKVQGKPGRKPKFQGEESQGE